MRIQGGYSENVVRIQWGYSEDTVRDQKGHSRKEINNALLIYFFILIGYRMSNTTLKLCLLIIMTLIFCKIN